MTQPVSTPPAPAAPPAPPAFQPITSQETLDRIIQERVARARPADYDELKTKAQAYDAVEEQNKTELQKEKDKTVKAEKERDEARAEALRASIQAEHGISKEDKDLFLTATDEPTLRKQAEALSKRAVKTGNVSPREGNTPAPAPSNDLGEFTKNLFGRTD